MGERARTASDGDFGRLTDPFRRELLAHCYRMLGSAAEAEDLVQETLLRAWRAYEDFEGRSTLRTWLYRIATNACLRELERTGRRPLPSGLGAPGNPERPLGDAPEVSWLQPMPDALVDLDPAGVVGARAGMRLAFVAALQHLPARQRAVLLLRDVLSWPAADVARLLDTSTAAVNSALQRARAQMQEVAPAVDTMTEPADANRRSLVDRYMNAFENADFPALTRLLQDDIEIEMPPNPE